MATDNITERTLAAAKVATELLERGGALAARLAPMVSTVDSAVREVDRATATVEEALQLAGEVRQEVSRASVEVAALLDPGLDELRTLASRTEGAAAAAVARQEEALTAQQVVIAAKRPVEEAVANAERASREAAAAQTGIGRLLAGLGIPHRWNGTRIAIRLPDGSFGEEIDLQGRGGDSGPDAYHVALSAGFVGTREEWLESLRGAGADPTDLLGEEVSQTKTWSSERIQREILDVASTVRPVRYPTDVGLRDRSLPADAAEGSVVFELDPDLGLSYRLVVGGEIFSLDGRDRIILGETPAGETTYPVEVEALTLEGWRKVFRVAVTTGVLLRLLGISSATFYDIDPPGTIIGTISNRRAASALAEVLSEERFVVRDDGTTARLIVGDTASAPGDTFAQVRETASDTAKTSTIPIRVLQRLKTVTASVTIEGVASSNGLRIGDEIGAGEVVVTASVPFRDRIVSIRLRRPPMIGDEIALTEFLP